MTFSPFQRLGNNTIRESGVRHSSDSSREKCSFPLPSFWGRRSVLGLLESQLHQSTTCLRSPESPLSTLPPPSPLPSLSSFFIFFFKTWSHYVAQAGH